MRNITRVLITLIKNHADITTICLSGDWYKFLYSGMLMAAELVCAEDLKTKQDNIRDLYSVLLS